MTGLGPVLDYAQALAVSVLVGKVVLLALVVAPVLATVLEPAPFASVVRALFPAYYALGAGAAALGLLSAGLLAAGSGLEPALIGALGLWAGVLGIELYCRAPLTPRINALSDRLTRGRERGAEDSAARQQWDRLHRRSVRLNTAVLLMGLCLIGLR